MSSEAPEPAQVYLQLRERILNLDPTEMDLHPSCNAPRVWGVLMETGYKVGSATFVALADGTTSLYYSTGGGMLGSGEFSPVAEASKSLVAQAEDHLQQVSLSYEFPLPEVGQVRFIFLTYTGLFTGEAPEKILAAGGHRFSPLFRKAHEILEQLKLLAEKKHRVHA